MMIHIDGVAKAYRALVRRRTVHALAEFSLEVERGEVMGIAGPNGAGKSTLLSLLLGFLAPTAGSIRLDGLPPRAYVERHGVGYLPELLALPARWTVDSAFRRATAIGRIDRPRIESALDAAGLAEQRHKRVRQLSKGNLQRLGLGLALLGDHQLLILDEPTHGLDPVWTVHFRAIVAQLRRPDRTILIASHNLDELERVADRVAIIHEGRLQRVVACGTGADAQSYRLVLDGAPESLKTLWPGIEAIPARPGEYRVLGDLDMLNLHLKGLLDRGTRIVSFHPEHSRLETEFRAAIGGDRP